MNNKDDHSLQAMRMPNWARYKALFFQKGKSSILRNLQYEILAEKVFKGEMLDFGGGERADYHRILTRENYESINIDSDMKPTWVTEIGAALPCPRDYYNHVLSMNTIEHIYDAQFVLREMHACLKVGGELVCALPFLYPIHAHPDDYFRPTASWWDKTLLDIGFDNIKITPLLWGPFSTGLVCSGVPGPLRGFRTHLALMMDWVYISMRYRLKKEHNASNTNFALGYFIEARKV